MTVTFTLTWTSGMRIKLGKIMDQYLSSYQRWIKSVIRLGNNEVLKNINENLNI